MPRAPRFAFTVAATIVLAAGALPAGRAWSLEYRWGHPSPQGNTVYAMDFRGPGEGWAVGGSGFVLHTLDDGQSWQLQQGPGAVAPNLYDVLVTPAGALLACGDGAGIYRSQDDGAIWSAVAPAGTGELRDLALVPGGGVSAAGTGGAVLVSNDDGLNWSAIGPGVGTIRHQAWLTATEGYVVGDDVVHRTTDGGAHWAQIVTNASFGYNEVFFTDADHGYIVEDFAYWATDNAGATWTYHNQFNHTLYRYRTLVLTPTHWLTVCNGEGGELWETTNAGLDWTLHTSESNTGFAFIERSPSGRIHYGSDTGDLVHTDDFGATRVNATVNHAQEAPSASMTFFVRRPDGVLFAQNQPSRAGEVASWLRSDDEGATWTEPPTMPGPRWLTSGQFFDNQRAVVGSYTDLRVTADGGETWQAAVLPTGYRLTDVALPALDRWFVAAAHATGGAVFRSTDQGVTWSAVAGGLPAGVTFNALWFTSPLTGYAGGGTTTGSPRLYRTLDGGATWQPVAMSGLATPITSWSWLDGQTVVAAARWSGVSSLSRSTNAGQTWTTVAAATVRQVMFRDANEGLAIRLPNGDPLHTTDGGLTWSPIQAPLSGAFPGLSGTAAAAAPTTRGFVLGADRNRILRVLPDRVAPVAGSLPPSPAHLTASPNPFNPSTVLRFRAEAAGSARLVIHDLRGRRVRMLLDGPVAEGEQVATWDGRDDRGRTVAAGAYLARLTGDAGTGSAKLLLVK